MDLPDGLLDLVQNLAHGWLNKVSDMARMDGKKE
jgi:hypothetical protein